jgi:DNA-binding NtrC family response regulator
VKGTILLVEDELDTRELLGRAIERAGYVCALAEGARQALERAADGGPFSAVVTDVVLGRDDRGGLTLMTDLRRAGVRAPFVIITAYADVEKVKIALNQGAAHLLEKPFRAPELLAVIERVCGQGALPAHAAGEVLSRARLTAKERTVALHLLDGLTSGEIAHIETNSPKTIRQHVSQIYAKCGVSSRADFFRLVYAGRDRWGGGMGSPPS